MQTTRQEQNVREAVYSMTLIQQDIERLQSYLTDEGMSERERRKILYSIRTSKVSLVRWTNALDEALDELFS